MKTVVLMTLVLLSGCSWFHRKPIPDPTELIVTGASAGSILYVDGARTGHPTQADDRTQVLHVVPGMHTLEVKVEESVAYRENIYIAVGEKRVITVLSGFSTQ